MLEARSWLGQGFSEAILSAGCAEHPQPLRPCAQGCLSPVGQHYVCGGAGAGQAARVVLGKYCWKSCGLDSTAVCRAFSVLSSVCCSLLAPAVLV